RTWSSVSTPGIGNWRATASGMTSTVATTYPGLPSGWTVNGSGKVVPPSKATTVSIPLRMVLLLSCSLSLGFAMGFLM
ncbi:hypothetical protein KCU76_g17959, partial [Aureobasidium melanogenum]